MGPVGHLGIPLPVAHLLKLNLPVTGFCALLPDLVDKPLCALGIVCCGRYAAHTLLFVFLVAIVFSLKNKRYGLSALFGGILHLALDSGNFVPWFYPFVSYDFPRKFSFPNLLHNYVSFSVLGEELIWVASIGLAVLLCLWFRRRSKARIYYGSQSKGTGDEEK